MSCDKKSNYACSSTTSSSSARYCCLTGDTCVGSSICYFTHPWAKASGYYLGGCTNATYPGPVCSKQCSDHPTQDIVYNSTTSLWACCYGSGSLDCSNPTDETFQAASPEQLMAPLGSLISSSTRTLWTSSSSSSTFPASVSSATTSSTTSIVATRTLTISQPFTSTRPADDKPSNSNPSSPLSSSGAKAGVGVGITIVGFGLLALSFYFTRRARRRKSTFDNVRSAMDISSNNMPTPANDSPYTPTRNMIELDGWRQQIELDSRTYVELDARVSKGGTDRQ